MVFNRVVGPSWEVFGDFSPFVADGFVIKEEKPFFILVPGGFLDHWVEVVVPTLTTLLADATVEMVRDEGPFLGTVLLDELDDKEVFFFCPGLCGKDYLLEKFFKKNGSFEKNRKEKKKNKHIEKPKN